MDPNGLPGKIIFSVIDKFIIGVLAALAVFYFQSKSAESQRQRAENAAIAKAFYTDVMLKQLENLNKALEELMFISEKIKITGKADQEQAKLLGDLRTKIGLIISSLGAVDKRISENKEPFKSFLQSINDLVQLMIEKRSPPTEIESMASKIRTGYLPTLEAIRKFIMENVKKEFRTQD